MVDRCSRYMIDDGLAKIGKMFDLGTFLLCLVGWPENGFRAFGRSLFHESHHYSSCFVLVDTTSPPATSRLLTSVWPIGMLFRLIWWCQALEIEINSRFALPVTGCGLCR